MIRVLLIILILVYFGLGCLVDCDVVVEMLVVLS